MIWVCLSSARKHCKIKNPPVCIKIIIAALRKNGKCGPGVVVTYLAPPPHHINQMVHHKSTRRMPPPNKLPFPFFSDLLPVDNGMLKSA